MRVIKFIFALLAILTVSVSFRTQEATLKKSMEDGKNIYDGICLACHLSEGQGIASVFPPLAKSDYLMEDLDRSIEQLLQGSSGEIEVNGKKYNGQMPATGLDALRGRRPETVCH